MSDMYLGSQAPLYQNVRIRCINAKTGKTRIERTAKNRITRLMLWGMSRFLAGEFNDSTPDMIYEYIPRFIGLGSNIPSADKAASVGTTVTVNDTCLLNEYTSQTSGGNLEKVSRINIQGRRHNKTLTRFSDDYIKLSFSMYVNSSQFDNLQIAEAGLFSKEQGNNCLARVVFPPFTKHKGEVLDIQWDITLLSYGTTKYAESLMIEGPNKITIPITYTPYKLVTKTTLLRAESSDVSGSLVITRTNDNNIMYTTNEDGFLVPAIDIDICWDKAVGLVSNTQAGRDWISSLVDQDINLFDLVNWLFGISYNKASGRMKYSQKIYISPAADGHSLYEIYNTPEWIERIDVNVADVSPLYLADPSAEADNLTILTDDSGEVLTDNAGQILTVLDATSAVHDVQYLLYTPIYEELTSYKETDTKCIIETVSEVEQRIVKTEGDPLLHDYRIKNRQVWEDDKAIDAYLHNGTFISKAGESLGYIVKEDRIYKLEIDHTSLNPTPGYITPATIDESTRYAFCTRNQKDLYTTPYYIDSADNSKVKVIDDNRITEYHITTDNYVAYTNTYRLSAVIGPADATDKDIQWNTLNREIALVNTSGVISAWNVGETMAIATTSNNIKARVTVEVVKNGKIIDTESIKLSTQDMNIIVENPSTYSQEVTASVLPIYATYNVVSWALDANAFKLCEIISGENNVVTVAYRDNGFVGRGYLTATTQDGVTAQCLITVSHATTAHDDQQGCDDPYHDLQHI